MNPFYLCHYGYFQVQSLIILYVFLSNSIDGVVHHSTNARVKFTLGEKFKWIGKLLSQLIDLTWGVSDMGWRFLGTHSGCPGTQYSLDVNYKLAVCLISPILVPWQQVGVCAMLGWNVDRESSARFSWRLPSDHVTILEMDLKYFFKYSTEFSMKLEAYFPKNGVRNGG